MAQLLNLPNEILNLIFENNSLYEIWNFQQCSILCETALDTHMLARHDAVPELMLWGCQRGLAWAIKKALSHGADIDVATRRYERNSVERFLTIVAAGNRLETIGLLLDLGARLDLKEDIMRRKLRTTILDSDHPEILQVCLDHGAKYQIADFQTGLDECLLSVVDTKCRFSMPHCVARWPEGTYEKCQAWLDLGANPSRLLENRTETAIERVVSNSKDESDPWDTIALVNLLLSATSELQSPAVETYRRQAV